MSITAKKSFTIKKKDISTQKSLAIGFKKVVFYHKATAGDTSMSLGTLVMPTELTAVGFTNASSSELLALQLGFYKDNFTLMSSARGLLQHGLSYTVSGSTISFTTSFGPALADEIFTGIVDPVAKNGNQIIDANQLVSTGTLAAGDDEYAVGVPYEVNKYPSAQVGAVLVYIDGLLQFRNAGNAAAAPAADGNYEEATEVNGLSNTIKFNIVDAVNARSITVISNGLLAERPSGSIRAAIESLQGQIDSVVPTVAALAGVPETNFQATPNDVDLKTFGDRVLGLEEPGSPGLPKLASSSVAGALTYQKGTFLPNLVKASGAGTLGTATVNLARFVKIQSLCHVEMEIDPITVTVGTVNLNFTLPFAAKNSSTCIIRTLDNSSAQVARVLTTAGSSTASVTPSMTTSAWSISAANSFIRANFDFEVDE